MNIISEILSNNGIATFEHGICGQINHLDCFYVSLSGSDAVRAWEILRNGLSDYYPVIMPVNFNDGEIISSEINLIKDDIDKYQSVNLESWFPSRVGDYDFDNEDDEMPDFYKETEEEPPTDSEPYRRFTVPYDILTGKPLKKIWITAFPAANFYEIPIYTQYGGWNACPCPSEHAAVMKYWNKLYGAELIGISNDVIEMKVSNPPKTYQQAFDLAKEQMAYCDDIVFQGTMTVERLAKLLVSGTSWFFWWD